MAESRRKKTKVSDKNFKVSVDTENFDAEITKDETGFKADIDTPRVDVHVEKKDNSFEISIDIDDKKHYECIGTGKDGKLPKGTIWKVTGEILKVFLKKGIAKIKEGK